MCVCLYKYAAYVIPNCCLCREMFFQSWIKLACNLWSAFIPHLLLIYSWFTPLLLFITPHLLLIILLLGSRWLLFSFILCRSKSSSSFKFYLNTLLLYNKVLFHFLVCAGKKIPKIQKHNNKKRLK